MRIARKLNIELKLMMQKFQLYLLILVTGISEHRSET